jgi:hypothetical protein
MGDASERLERLLTDPKAKAAFLAGLAIKQLRDDPAAVALIEQAAG